MSGTRFPLFLLTCLSLLAFQCRAAVALADEDQQAIRAVALDYAEGWYGGDRQRLQQSLHPALAKRRYAADDAGQMRLDEMDATRLLAANHPDNAEHYATAPRRADVVILDGFGHIASVKLVMDGWIDYLHVVRDGNGRWRIINVLWDVPPGDAVDLAAQGGDRLGADTR